MPLYRFALAGQDPALDEPPLALADDVEAMKYAAGIASDLARHREDYEATVVAIRAAKSTEKFSRP
jgi:hypothetical protein